MSWTTTKPTVGGWYFYREPGENMNKSMMAWVFTKGPVVYVSMFAPHGEIPQEERGQTKDYRGEWWGPVELPE